MTFKRLNREGVVSTTAVRGAGHNDTYLVGGEAYWRTIADFLETVGRGPVAEP